MRALAAALVFVPILTACAGRAPVPVESGAQACPDISGSYCIDGLRWERGSTKLRDANLLWYLGVKTGSRDVRPDRVTLAGVDDGVLRVSVYEGDRSLATATLERPALECGAERVLVKMEPQSWGGSGPILAFGGSGGWNLISRGDDGRLRIQQVRRERGVILLTLPLAFSEESWARFDATDRGCGS